MAGISKHRGLVAVAVAVVVLIGVGLVLSLSGDTHSVESAVSDPFSADAPDRTFSIGYYAAGDATGDDVVLSVTSQGPCVSATTTRSGMTVTEHGGCEGGGQLNVEFQDSSGEVLAELTIVALDGESVVTCSEVRRSVECPVTPSDEPGNFDVGVRVLEGRG